MRASIIVSALVAALVGFGGTVAVVVAAAAALGADADATASWVTGVCLAIAIATGVLSVRHKMPIVAAWSTPGAALIAASDGATGMEAAVGAFVFAALLILATAAWRRLGSLVAAIPTAIAAAMLAGILFRFVVAIFENAQLSPALVLPLLALFLLVRQMSPLWAVLAVLAAGTGAAFLFGQAAPIESAGRWATTRLVLPSFEPATFLGLGLPLYLVTMASQNLPGFAVLRAAGYEPPARSILGVTGLTSLLTAFLGAHTSNLAAITASICTNPDAHPDPRQRWLTGPVYAGCYLLLAAGGASLVTVVAALPAALVATVAGTALISPCVQSLGVALDRADHRFAAVLTLAVTASGMTLLGIGSAFWGLLAGLAVLALDRNSSRGRPARVSGSARLG